MFQDKELNCVDCGVAFLFTANDQAFYQEKGFTNEPKRCRTCREKRKDGNSRSARPQRGERKLFPATCSMCGRQTQVPFKPAPGRSVKCKACLGPPAYSRYATNG